MRTKKILLNSLIEQTSVCESNEFSICDKQTYKCLRRFAIAKLNHLILEEKAKRYCWCQKKKNPSSTCTVPGKKMLGYTNKVYGALIAAENLIAALTAPIAAN